MLIPAQEMLSTSLPGVSPLSCSSLSKYYEEMYNNCINLDNSALYFTALQHYLTISHVKLHPFHPLNYPCSNFYAHKKGFRLLFPFYNPEGTRTSVYRTLNRSCLFALFQFWKLPIWGYEYEIDCLYNALTNLLEQRRFNRYEVILQAILIRYPTQGNRLLLAIQNSCQTLTGQLLVNTLEDDATVSNYMYRLWSADLLHQEIFYDATSFPSSLLRTLFREFRLSTKLLFGPPSWHQTHCAFPDSITYVLDEQVYRILVNCTGDSGPLLHAYMGPASCHTEKLFQIAPLNLNRVPKGAELFLYMLTSGNVDMLDKLATLFYEIMTNQPTKPNMTVLYAPINAPRIRTLLYRIFSSSTAQVLPTGDETKKAKKKEKLLPSFSTVVQKKPLMSLAVQNVFGRALLFIDDSLPQEGVRPICRKLINGKSVKLQDACADNQHFTNNIHFLCVTETKNKSDKLVETFSVPLIDLSASEQLIPSDFILNAEDINWLKSAFALYGLFLRLTEESSKKERRDSQNSPRTSDAIQMFLHTCCTIGGSVTGFDLYEAFCSFYMTMYGVPTRYTKIVFTKAVAKHYTDSPNVEYRKSRMNQEKLLWQFVGLQVNPNWKSLLCPPDASQVPIFFHSKLSVIYTILPTKLLQQSGTQIELPEGVSSQ